MYCIPNYYLRIVIRNLCTKLAVIKIKNLNIFQRLGQNVEILSRFRVSVYKKERKERFFHKILNLFNFELNYFIIHA